MHVQRLEHELEIEIEQLRSRTRELDDQLHQSRDREQKAIQTVSNLNSRLEEANQEQDVSVTSVLHESLVVVILCSAYEPSTTSR